MSVTNVWTEGVCGDGAAILRNGTLMTISNVLEALNDRERLVAVNAELLAALKAARRIIIAAVTLGVDIPGFDPSRHSVVVTMDAAIARAEGAESNRERKDAT